MDVAARIIVMLLVDRSQPERVTLNSRSHQESLAPAIRVNQLGKVLVTELVENTDLITIEMEI